MRTVVTLFSLVAAAACSSTDPVRVEESPPPDVILLTPTVSPSFATLHVGDTLRLSAGSLGRVSWSSADASIASVDSVGTVHARRQGDVTIIATSPADPNVKGAAAVRVIQ